MAKFEIVIRQDGLIVYNGAYELLAKVEPVGQPFKVGDYVLVARGYTCVAAGARGKIVAVDSSYGVEFMEYDINFHSLGGRVPRGHGYWIPADYLELRA